MVLSWLRKRPSKFCTLAAVPRTRNLALLHRGFLPALISVPFENGLRRAFDFAGVACLVAALASWLSGERYVHQEPMAGELVDGRDLGEVARVAPEQADGPLPAAADGGDSSSQGRAVRA